MSSYKRVHKNTLCQLWSKFRSNALNEYQLTHSDWYIFVGANLPSVSIRYCIRILHLISSKSMQTFENLCCKQQINNPKMTTHRHYSDVDIIIRTQGFQFGQPNLLPLCTYCGLINYKFQQRKQKPLVKFIALIIKTKQVVLSRVVCSTRDFWPRHLHSLHNPHRV